MLVVVVDYEHPENADFLKAQFAESFDTILISSFSRVLPKTADVVVENKFYTGLWNEAVRRALSKRYQWLLLVASDLRFVDFLGAPQLRDRLDRVCASQDVGVYTFSVSPESRCAFPDLIRQHSRQDTRETETVEGFAFLTRTALLEKMYPVSPDKNKYGWGLDTALCELARQQNYKVIVDDGVCVYHPPSAHVIDTQKALSQYGGGHAAEEYPLHTISEVYEYYRKIAESYAGRGLRILKTDAHNESGIWGHSIPLAPIIAPGNALTCVEVCPDVLAKAKARYPDLDMHLGDVRTWAGQYDVVLDFSTIDHVPNYVEVLRNYKKIASEINVIVWLSDTNRRYDDQYLFCEQEFKQAFFDVFGAFAGRAIFSGQHTGIASIAHGVLHHFKYSPPPATPWKYLDELGYRYKIVSELVDFKDKHVVDLCSGNTGLYELVRPVVKSYRACDKRKQHDIVEQVDDAAFAEIITQCDILCLFGYGGYEFTQNALESSTVLNSVQKLITKFNPVVILESVTKFESALQKLAASYYNVRKIHTRDAHWLKDRVIYILVPR